MKIEEGKFYRTRGDEKRGPMKRVRHAIYPWYCNVPIFRSYTEDGRFYDVDGRISPEDLVAEWREPVLSGPAVELSTLADLDAQPGDVIGMLNVLSKHSQGGPICRVFDVLDDGYLRARDTASTHARVYLGEMPAFFMIHRAPRDAGSIDDSPSELLETPEETRRMTYETRAKLDRVLGRTTPTDSPEPNPDHEAENSRDALLDGPD